MDPSRAPLEARALPGERLGTTSPGDRHAIIEVRSGPIAGERVILRPGSVLRVGRGARADLSIPADKLLSEAHFALGWDGKTGSLVDAGTASGTLLDGHRVARAEWGHGAWIRAGGTDMMILVEGRTRVPLSPGPRKDAALVDRAASQLGAIAKTGRLFGVLDAARDRRIHPLLREATDEHRCLYEGTERETMAEVAPYLVRFEAGSRLLATIVAEGWGRSWGVHLTSSQPLRALAAALRGLLQVETDFAPGKMFFRFYDPRVLRVLSPLTDGGQRRELFRAVDAYLVEDEDGALRAHTESRPEGALLRMGAMGASPSPGVAADRASPSPGVAADRASSIPGAPADRVRPIPGGGSM